MKITIYIENTPLEVEGTRYREEPDTNTPESFDIEGVFLSDPDQDITDLLLWANDKRTDILSDIESKVLETIYKQ